MAGKPREVRGRVLRERLGCTVCRRALEREIVAGAIAALNNCTLTEGCSGILVSDPGVELTALSELNWVDRPVTVHREFRRVRRVDVVHGFDSDGSVIVECWIEVVDAGTFRRVRSEDFQVVSRGRNSITVEFPVISSGAIVVTDNGHSVVRVEDRVDDSAVEREIDLITGGEWLTVALDRNVATGVGSELYMSVMYKEYNSSVLRNRNVPLYNLVSDPRSRPGDSRSVFRHTRLMYIRGRQFNLYTARIPAELRARGVAVDIAGIDGGVAYLPFAVADKSGIGDIQRDRIVTLSAARWGNITADGSGWIVGDHGSVLFLDPQLLLL